MVAMSSDLLITNLYDGERANKKYKMEMEIHGWQSISIITFFNCHLALGVHREGEGGRNAKCLSKIHMLHTLKAVEHKPHGTKNV